MFLPLEHKCMEATLFSSLELKGKIASMAGVSEDEKHTRS